MNQLVNVEKTTLLAVVGAVAASLVGGWDGAAMTLCIFMAADYLSGVTLAAVFRKSNKSKSGALESRAGLKGIIRKTGMLLAVIVAVRLDIMSGLGGTLRTGVIIALTANEALSIVENLGLMGVPLPRVLTKLVEQLRSDTGDKPED